MWIGGLWVVLAVALLFAAWMYARAGLAHVERATRELAPEDLVVGDNLGPLRAARADFEMAERLSGFPAVRVLGAVPFVGRQVRGAHTLGAAAADVLDAGVDAVERSRDGIDGFREGGPARVEGMRLMASIARRSRERIAGVDLGSSSGLVGPLARARNDLSAELPDLEDALADLDDAATGFAEFLAGPRTYLLFAANNNEMRLGSGAFLSTSVLLTDNGDLTLFPPRPTATLRLGPLRAGAAPLDPDQAQLWGWLAPNDEWRNLAASPRFDTTAKLSKRMLDVLRPDLRIDGVLALDPVALQELVGATGPVHVGRRSLSGERLLKYVLLDQYRGVEFFDTRQRARRDALGTLAQQAVDHLDDGEWNAGALVRALRGAARGRHVLAWSRHPNEEKAWQIAEVDGRMQRDSLMVGLHNRGGNKLDVFMGVDSHIRTKRVADGTDVSVTVTLGNVTPDGLPRYVAGPYPGSRGGARNLYQGIATIYVPSSAAGIQVTRTHGTSEPHIVAAGLDGAHRAVGVQVRLASGQRDRLRFDFHLPERVRALTVEPSARFPNIHWTFEPDAWWGGQRWNDTEAHTVHFGPARERGRGERAA
jgi:hypothetical protein